MADKTISDLDLVTTFTDNDLFVLQQGGAAMRAKKSQLVTEFARELDGHGGISSISKTGTSGLVDTYTITYGDGTTDYMTVTNGAKGDSGTANYVHIRYSLVANPSSTADIKTNPSGCPYIGIYTGTSSSAPTTPSAYVWAKYVGETPQPTASATQLPAGSQPSVTVDTSDPLHPAFTFGIPKAQIEGGGMSASDYDPNNVVLAAGGIPAYVTAKVPASKTKLSEFTDDLGTNPTHTHAIYATIQYVDGLVGNVEAALAALR